MVPGRETEENLDIAQQAIDIFQQVLNANTHNVGIMKRVAEIYLSIKKLDEAKNWQKKVFETDPSDSSAANTIGWIDDMQANEHVQEALAASGLHDDGMGNAKAPASVMETLNAQNAALVREAIQYLNQAIAIRSGYVETLAYLDQVYRRKANLDLDWGDETARRVDIGYIQTMGYLNQAYRRKADLDWDDEAARKDDLAQADDWQAKATAASWIEKRAEEEEACKARFHAALTCPHNLTK